MTPDTKVSSMEEVKTPWWLPQLCDEAYFARLREDYPDDADLSDEELQEEYADGRKYAVTWDHAGDAYAEYEPMADAFFEIIEALERIIAASGVSNINSAPIDDARALLNRIRNQS